MTVTHFGVIAMKFEPFKMYQYEYSIVPARTHSIWGGFKGLAAMSLTLDSLRHTFSSCVLLIDGDIPESLLGAYRLPLESRYTVGGHNGRLVQCAVRPVHFLDVSSVDALDYAGMLLSLPSAALFSLTSRSPLEPVKAGFDKAVNLESLRASLFSIIAAYIGFDHDAFFTFETRDAAMVREALRSADIEGDR